MIVDIRDAVGRRITKVYAPQGDAFDTEVVVSDERQLFNFELRVGSQTLLILDPYGNDMMPDIIRTRVFGDHKEKQWTIGINRNTGSVHLVTLILEDNLLAFVVQERQDKIPLPERYIRRIGELRNKKRPFRFQIHHDALQDFINQDVGYDTLRTQVLLYLDFDGAGIELWDGHVREVAKWQLVSDEDASNNQPWKPLGR